MKGRPEQKLSLRRLHSQEPRQCFVHNPKIPTTKSQPEQDVRKMNPDERITADSALGYEPRTCQTAQRAVYCVEAPSREADVLLVDLQT